MQTVFITGASSGIGAALARSFAEQGAVLGLVARRQDVLEQLRQSLPNADKHQIYPLDVTDHAALAKAATDFIQAVGQVNVVVANAGISVGTLTEHAEDIPVFARVIETNLIATVATFAPFIASMQGYAKQQDCRLVGIGSVAGIRGLPGAEAYSASKAAVISYCESLRVELRSSGIKVVTIAPGYIDTPMTRDNPYPMPFLMPVEAFAKSAVAAIDRGDSYRIIPWQMGVVAKLMRVLPNWLYDRVFAKARRKPRANES
ncbi:SDR family oxidoreductase [Undibacterium sp. RTI2.1]|uniref:SDR family oxidoreductase n=1 Tax=unclassified Undibacterium TaxID=2630295 RepID=UPI002AB45BAB|nr:MULTISPECIES: SDR family oxidoreductase [unclassified Undibacterium]MDY7539500.1 SDR family oxidoreductase [Undibacterium sp. 5I1]MEB0029584.1 SDR family oxidoreductase [Undibacterium sp. RTI2.1]MEB0116055.1 SDR family oxidoreductase [Undibacterium sp. RTI2.2]MEB0230758.1 SDR family oxidoreductase [Undibacterium sp. 10I3]MEB0258763.1 SDR family oxidoreductase [Undibacterium sp. 5I1]